jgi:hypothetical protein
MRKYNCRRHPATSGRCCQIPACTFGRIWPKLQDSGLTPPDPVRSGRIPVILAKSGQILSRIHPDPDHFGQTRPASDHGRIPAKFSRNLVRRHPATVVRCRRIPAPAIFRWPDVAEFRCRLDSDNRISNVRARMKNLISKNDLLFSKP